MPIYCVDTSAFIAAWVERYPIDTFPPLWDELATLIAAGRLIAPEAVQDELDKKSKDLLDWFEAAGSPFVKTDAALIAEAMRILQMHERLVMESKRASAADPFVIALARTRGCIVVTEEHGGTAAKPKIPFVCNGYGVPCLSLLDLLRTEGIVIGGRRR
ncbi:DUF4411 family protein [Phreatobacter cathodiphilus]|uniref:DUF4411 family protein n=1 Tax=Phreatobacter cathodiphilus TaxID=1868589 RepID=UPI0015E634A5|nr:DUF4411 family protein [Phreatobacter cathodiphilus]